MKILLFIFTIFLNCFVSCSNNQSIFRRIGGMQHGALEYPPYVVEVRIKPTHFGEFGHQCMGTLLSHTWSISSEHCFPGLISLQSLAIFHGSKTWNKCSKYAITKIHKHDHDDIVLVNHEKINIAEHLFPKLTGAFCPHEVRGVYHSFGRNSDNETPVVLLYSTNDVNEDLCKNKIGWPNEKVDICFSAVDWTLPNLGDSGAGIMTGYGPGPMFPDTHDVKIIGIVDSWFNSTDVEPTANGRVLLARRVSEYIAWIQRFVENVRIVD